MNGGGGRGARPTNALVRAKSDHWLKHEGDAAKKDEEDEDFELRHGWQDEYNSSEYLKILNSVSLLPSRWYSFLIVTGLIVLFFFLFRISTCILMRSAMIRGVYPNRKLEAGCSKIGE